MQFRHAVAARPLETHHGNEIALQLAGLERLDQLQLILEYQRRRFNYLMLRRHRGHLHHATTEIALHQAQSAFCRERLRYRCV